MIVKNINPGIFEIDVTVKDIIYGNTMIDRYTGYDDVEATTLKLRCLDCTVMVFRRDMHLFKGVSVGYRFKAVVKEWKDNIYKFKKLVE